MASPLQALRALIAAERRATCTKAKKLKISITAPEAMRTIWLGLGWVFMADARLQGGGDKSPSG